IRAVSRATNIVRPLRARTMSAITRASKPSGAPIRSSRPGSSTMRFICDREGGRTSSAITPFPRLVGVEAELLQARHHGAVEFRRRRPALDDPLVEVLVGLFEQALELVQLG